MSLALYRRYRPETFAEVIGQEHVTDPLQQALRNNRVNHAYLFSGPRGCGKTTSARILARCLNCERGPTPTPCGECQSCQDLARNGPGSIDVIEIDAASHGGVDDARDLREKAFFGPAGSRYKIYIIDEAHMVTSAGFNALLKVVEEPPEHLKFIFATTEPEKVIGTIRSRTHHYPFRLVPPGTLRDHLAAVCEQEGIQVEDGVYPLVVRAGAGSVRDSMSVMDQLLAGADAGGVTYAMATALLGYTDAALLDDVVDGFAAGDGAAVFEIVDRVVEGGHDPRRFVADLLERLRDLVIIAAVPDAVDKGLVDAPKDVVERMRAQASVFGGAELSRAADLVNTGLTEMRGATSPRLQLELICARVLLPAAYDDERSLQARLERLERGVSLGGGFGAGGGAGGGTGGGAPGGAGDAGGGSQAAGGGHLAGPAGPAAARAALGRTGAGGPGAASGTGQGAGGPAGPGGYGTGPAADSRTVPARPQGPGPEAPHPTGTAPSDAPGAVPNGPHGPTGQPSQGGPQASPQTPGAAPPRAGEWPVAAQAGAGTPPPQAPPAERRRGAWPTAAGAGSGSPSAGPGRGAPAPAAQTANMPTTPATPAAPGASSAPVGDATRVRQVWPQIVDAVKHRRLTWMLLLNNARVVGFDGETLQIGFDNPGARNTFANGDSEDVLKRAISEVCGAKWRIETMVDPGGGGGGGGGRGPSRPSGQGPGAGGFGGQGGGAGAPSQQAGGQHAYGSGPGAGVQHPSPSGPRPDTPGSGGGSARGATGPSPASAAARAAVTRTGGPSGGGPGGGHGSGGPTGSASAGYAEEPPPLEDDIPEDDDPGLVDFAVSSHDLIINELGATVIEEIRHD